MFKHENSEVSMLRACLEGQTETFAAIVQKYQSLICAITYSATGSVDKSEELAQQAFIKAWNNLYQLKDLSKFRSWLCSIARHVINDFFRRQKNEITSKAIPMDSIQGHPSEDAGPVEASISKEREAIVNEALSKIPDTFREPLILYYREDKSYRQVADQLGFSEHTARQRISHAKNLLRKKVTSLVEETIEKTKPSKVFTTAVIASISGLAIKGSGVASAAGIGTATATTGTATGIAAMMSGVTAKIITSTAVIVIGVGAVVTFKHATKPSNEPEFSQLGIVAQEEKNEQGTNTEKPYEQNSDNTAELLPVDESQIGLEIKETAIKSPEPVSTEDTEFKFAPKGVLSGLITDAKNHEPVNDAKVYVTNINGGRIYESKTDSNGFYYFKNTQENGDYRIQIFSKKYVGVNYRDKVTIHLEKENKAVKHFKLQRACMIEVKVVNEQGEPVAGAYFNNTLPEDKEKREIGDPMHTEKTDDNGTIILGGFKPMDTPYLIVATHRVRGELVQEKDMRYYETYRDYAPCKLEIILNDPNIIEYGEIVLEKGISIAGYVEYLDGKPATDLKISAYPKWWHSHHCPESYAVDANGYFILEHITPGTYEIQASVPVSDDSWRGISLGYRELPLEDGELLELRFPESSTKSLASISGTVKWIGEGKPRYVHIEARTAQGLRSFTDLPRNRKGELENNFLVERLTPGIYTLKFTGDDIEEMTIGNIRAPSEGLIVEIPIKHQTKLRGKVLDKHNGTPVTNFEVRLDRDWVRFENAKGEFELALKGYECKRVSVRADGYATKLSEEICPDANEPTIIKLDVGGAIEGKVVNEKGNPIEGAKISYRYRRSRDEKPDDKYITATDPNGWFIIENVPESDTWRWFVINHPNYAPELKQIETEQDYIADVEIVLKEGGAVEGYVYDSQGKLMPDTTLYFLDESSYNYWEENIGRLGVVTTDSNGFYRINGMPEKLCFGFRQDPDKQLGIVSNSILSKNGKTSHLDFGGQWYTAGSLLQDGKPMSNIKLMIRGNKVGWETTFTAYALTDSEGIFTFWGIPSGYRYLYWSIPGLRSQEQWSEIGQFYFESGVDMDMGDFNLDLAEVIIRINAESPDESLNQLDVYIHRYDEKVFYDSKAGQLLPRAEPNDPYIFHNLSPGIYEAIARRPGYPTIHKVFEIKQGQKQYDVNLWIPVGSATLSGKIIPSDPKELQIPLILRSINQEITMGIRPAADGSYEIGDLPAGDYIIGRASVALSRQSRIKEVSLRTGENKKLDIEVDRVGIEYGGYLVVMVVTEEGLPLAGTNLWLEKGGNIIEPLFDSDKNISFAGDMGEYTLHAEYPGYREIQQRVNLKSQEGLSTQEILKPVVITMFKQ